MNNKEVYINGRLVDLDEAKSPIRLTYSVNNLGELKDRQAYSTNSFKLPPTQNNIDICGYPNNPEIIGLQPYRKNTAKIVQNGIEILVDGIAIITSSSITDINVQILSGLKGFFDTLGEKKLKDLDLSEWDHIWELETVALSQENTEGYIYPVIDYGGLSDTEKRADTRQLRPATFRKTIIEQMAIDAGYTISGSYSAYQKYIDSIVPFTNDKFEHSEEFINQPNTFSSVARSVNGQQMLNDFRDGTFVFTDYSTTDPGNNWDGDEYTAPITLKVKAKLSYSIRIRDQYKGGAVPSITIRLQKYNGSTWNTFAENTHIAQGEFTDHDYLDQVIENSIDLSTGNKIRVVWHSEPATDRVYGLLFPNAIIDIKYEPVEVLYEQEVQLAATLPDITQKNFFKDFLQQFGLIVIPDNYNKSLLLINMEDVYNNKPNAYDISDKLFNSVDNNSFSLDNYGIRNLAKYKDDDNVVDGLGDGVFYLDNQTLEDEATVIDSIFSATENINKMGGIQVAVIKKIEDVEVSSEFKIKTQPRILLNSLLNTDFTFFDATGTQTAFTISVPKFDGLSYERLIDENYGEIIRMLYRPYLVTKEILLSETDIANIDWSIPVYDKKTASYYYKNQITYQQGSLSTISLIRMP